LFLAARRGRLFALAAVPFHLLFHFYNGLSFLIGALRHYLIRREMPESKKTVAVASER